MIIRKIIAGMAVVYGISAGRCTEVKTTIVEYEAVVEAHAEIESKESVIVTGGEINGTLISIDNEDSEYHGDSIELSEEDRQLIGQVIRTEAGTGFEEQALIAQCIRDTMQYYEDGCNVEKVIKRYKYACDWDKEQNENTQKAIEYVFDNGGIVVRHKICFFYAPRIIHSKFHESQQFVLEYGGHRYFCKWQ